MVSLKQKIFSITNPLPFICSYIQNLRPFTKLRIYGSLFEFVVFIVLALSNIAFVYFQCENWGNLKA